LLNFASNTLNIILLFLRFYHDFSHQLPWGSPCVLEGLTNKKERDKIGAEGDK